MMASTAGPSLQANGGHQDNGLYPQHNQGHKSPSPPPQHRRGYQACDPCRKRKVKCDLGSVDNPRPPPCVRCRRESKRCEFSATRRKRKASDTDEVEGPLRRDARMMVGEVGYNDSSSNGSPYPQPVAASFENERASSRPQWSESSLNAGQIPRSSPVQQYHASASTSSGHFQDTRETRSLAYTVNGRGAGPSSYALESGQHMMNKTAAELLSPTISNSHDALHLLSEAAGRTEDLNRQSLENRLAARQSTSSFTSPGSSVTQVGTPRSTGRPFPRTQGPGTTGGYYPPAGSGPVDPQISDNRGHADSSVDLQAPGYLDAVKAWSRLRFVRAGWLTVEEAMAYIAYYYEHLAPLSPIVLPDYSPPSMHRTLLTEEPVLAVTMLTVASRHMKPKGDGAYTRSFYIHDRLWSYLRGMIERLFWGQENFGGSAAGLSKPRSLDIAPIPGKVNLKGHLRSLGTVEALLMLTDWHPRNLHFPPGDDENTLLDADAHISPQIRPDKDADNETEQAGNKGQSSTPEGRLAFQKWLEPAWRSDRMSWMLLSTAQALAFELGVFDQKNASGNNDESAAEQMRKRRVRRLILVYVTQSSGRLGIPSMLPLPQWSHDIEPTSLGDMKASDVLIDRMQDCWIGISKIMHQSNQLLFASKEQTSELIRSGRYREQINEFLPSLREFRRNLDSLSLSPQMRYILTIEYEYTRLYVNCLALQAVVDRWTTMSNEATAQAQSGRPGSGPSSGTASFRVLMELYRVNEPYIQEVVDASRKILQTVLDGLVPGDHLKHAPVRTYFRILSGMIFILKTFTLGATEDDVRVSLDLQDRTIDALRTRVVDDVHLSHTIARLLELLTTNIRTRFLRFAPLDRAGDNDSQDHTSAPASRNQSPRPLDRGSAQGGRRDNTASGHHQWQQGQNATQGLGQSAADGNNNGTAAPIGSSGHDPLANIPAQPINSTNINVAFMPPPPSVYYNYYDPNATSPASKMEDSTIAPQSMNEGTTGAGTAPSGSSGALPDWFALPLDQFFNSSTAGVDQGLGGTGPMVGEFDMLEILLNEQYDKNDEGGDAAVGGGLPSQFM